MNSAIHEEIIDPAREIIDSHHHLWDRPGSRYMVEEFLRDAQAGHRVRQSVFIQCRTGYRHGTLDSPALETRAIADATRACQQLASGVRVAAGIVGYADMRQGAQIAALLEAHIEAGDGRFKGVRHIVSWADGAEFQVEGYPTSEGMLRTPAFGAALRELARLDLSFEAMVYHTQLGELAALAADHDNVRIVLNHIGLPLGIGQYAASKDQVFAQWCAGLQALARYPNVCLKLGGMGMHMLGLELDHLPGPLSSLEVAQAYRPYIDACVQAFGPERCMFESNFPVDRTRCHYPTLWNAFKRAVSGYSEHDRNRLFSDTAKQFYRLL